MSCSRGKANPNTNTQRYLFARSGGYCQNPGCNDPLFVDVDADKVSVAEMAHIFAAQDDGPRADPHLSEEMRGSYKNLILLCAKCHKIIDKKPKFFPDSLIVKWKEDHERLIAAVFGAISYGTRAEAYKAMHALAIRTRIIHQRVGPDNEYRWNPEADEATEWKHQVRQTIIPTNRSILALLDRNRTLLHQTEMEVVELFRQHIEGVERRHIFNQPLPSAPLYPRGIEDIFKT